MINSEHTYSWLHWKYWRNILANAILISTLGVSLIILIALAGEDFWDKPPVSISRIDPEDLGVVCPGQFLPVSNFVKIEDPVIVIYYIGVMDSTGTYNIIGNQETFPGYQHPITGVFRQTFPWRVPDLEPGIYTRSFAARGTDTSEKTVFITSTLTIGYNCAIMSDRRENESR